MSQGKCIVLYCIVLYCIILSADMTNTWTAGGGKGGVTHS